jgi:hypothetical protein
MRRNLLGLPLPERRRVILDEDVNWKLVHELRKRGRVDATALFVEKLDGKKDGGVLKALSAGYEPCVLVTYDNKMLKVHAAEVQHHGSTVAVVDEAAYLASDASNAETYIRDVVHRWLHRIEVQPSGTTCSYSQRGVSRVGNG